MLGSTYQNGGNAAGCKTVSDCAAGTFISAVPTTTSNRECKPCTEELTYQDLTNQGSCKSLQQCGAGTAVAQVATLTSNRVCEACVLGSTFQDGGNIVGCKAVSDCAMGTYVVKAPTTTSDRVCASCVPEVSFSSALNSVECRAVTTCTAGETMSATVTSDRVCVETGGMSVATTTTTATASTTAIPSTSRLSDLAGSAGAATAASDRFIPGLLVGIGIMTVVMLVVVALLLLRQRRQRDRATAVSPGVAKEVVSTTFHANPSYEGVTLPPAASSAARGKGSAVVGAAGGAAVGATERPRRPHAPSSNEYMSVGGDHDGDEDDEALYGDALDMYTVPAAGQSGGGSGGKHYFTPADMHRLGTGSGGADLYFSPVAMHKPNKGAPAGKPSAAAVPPPPTFGIGARGSIKGSAYFAGKGASSAYAHLGTAGRSLPAGKTRGTTASGMAAAELYMTTSPSSTDYVDLGAGNRFYGFGDAGDGGYVETNTMESFGWVG